MARQAYHINIKAFLLTVFIMMLSFVAIYNIYFIYRALFSLGLIVLAMASDSIRIYSNKQKLTKGTAFGGPGGECRVH